MAEPPVGGPTNPTLLASGGNPLTKLLLEGAGFHFVPGKTLPRPGPLALTWLAPQPFGLVSPEKYGIPADYLFGLPRDVTELFFEPMTSAGFDERKRLVVAKEAAAALNVFARSNLSTASDAVLETAEQLYRILARTEYDTGSLSYNYFLDRTLLTSIDAERLRRTQAAAAALPQQPDHAATAKLLREVPVGTLAVLLLVALQAQNPADP